MTNYDKIKKLLEAGFMVGARLNDDYTIYSYSDNNYVILSSLMSNGNIRRSHYKDDLEECYNSLGAGIYAEKEINHIDFTEIKPIPHFYKEIKGRVDILDCPEIREIIEMEGWKSKKVNMIGQKGLEINKYYNNCGGQHYEVYSKDKINSYTFPAQFVVPHLGDDLKKETIKIGDKEYIKSEFEEATKNLKTIK